jgi:hypothetical protein
MENEEYLRKRDCLLSLIRELIFACFPYNCAIFVDDLRYMGQMIMQIKQNQTVATNICKKMLYYWPAFTYRTGRL